MHALIYPLFSLLFSCSSEPNKPAQVSSDKSPKSDVLLIVVDTLRADALNSYGNSRPVGVNASLLSDQGVRFSQAWAPASWTWDFLGAPAAQTMPGAQHDPPDAQPDTH